MRIKRSTLFITIILISFLISCASAQITSSGTIYLGHSSQQYGHIIKTNQGDCSISEIDQNIILLNFYEYDGEIAGQKSYTSLLEPGIQRCTINDSDEILELKFEFSIVRIQKKPFQVNLYKSNGRRICQMNRFIKSDDFIKSQFLLTRQEKISGGGMRALPMNRRGHLLKLYNAPQYAYEYPAGNLNYSIPFFISSEKYGIYYDNVSDGYADIGKTHKNILEFGSKGGRQAWYIIHGDSFASIVESFTRLSGRQPLPPLWSLGNLQSRMAYKTQQQTEDIVSQMQKAKFPMDAIILDLYWFGDSLFGTMGNLDWHKPSWPDPKSMITDFKSLGIKTILITEPFILEDSKKFKEADSLKILAKDASGNSYIIKDFYFGKSGLIDIFDSTAKNWMWKQYNRLLKYGIAGWWIDLAEPETHPDSMIHCDGPAWLVHNAYGHIWDEFLFKAYQKEYPEIRLFNLNRSGFAGSQRYSVFPWSGDVSRSWKGLEAQLPIMLGMGICGPAYIHSDLGGFALGVKDEELYTRWLQFGVFSPIFRPHGSKIPSEPIFYSETTQNIVRQAIQLRYALLPYNYTLSWLNTQHGTPLARPIFYETNNAKHLPTYDTYFWGPNILVSPVFTKGQKKKRVLFPPGEWIDFYSGEIFQGNKSYRIKLKSESIPVFVKKGTILPIAYPIMNTTEYKPDSIIVHYYASAEKTEFTMFTDDGENPGSLKSGDFRLIHFTGQYNDIFKFEIKIDDNRKLADQAILYVKMRILGISQLPEKVLFNNSTVTFTFNSKEKFIECNLICNEVKNTLYIPAFAK
ncbi:MAG: glycoside hydrolase family 31 protein [Bacteroidales bacterium]|nr:glycoside hydrolase family 31 protein [Bacteroidales bacterium]